MIGIPNNIGFTEITISRFEMAIFTYSHIKYEKLTATPAIWNHVFTTVFGQIYVFTLETHVSRKTYGLPSRTTMYVSLMQYLELYFSCWAQHIGTINSLRPRQNGRHFTDDIFECIFLNENVWISLEISLKFVPEVRINTIPTLVQIMAWRRPGDKPLSEPMMVNLLTHICVTRPQWVKTCQYPTVNSQILTFFITELLTYVT